MALARTAAQLFGSHSHYQLLADNPIVEKQEDSFSGLQDSLFVTSLGGRGHRARFGGLLRTSAKTTLALASAELISLIGTIQGYERDGTLIDLFSGDSSTFATLVSQGQIWRGVVDAFESLGRERAPDGANFRVLCNFRLDFRIIAKV